MAHDSLKSRINATVNGSACPQCGGPLKGRNRCYACHPGGRKNRVVNLLPTPTAEPDKKASLIALNAARREMRAMDQVVEALENLPAESARRVLGWLREIVQP